MATRYLPNGRPAPTQPKKKKKKLGIGGSAGVGSPAPQNTGGGGFGVEQPEQPQQLTPTDVAGERGQETLNFPGIKQPQPSSDFYENLPSPDATYQSVDAQYDAIVAAYREVHHKDPPVFVMTMLMTSTPPNTTQLQYKNLLMPTGYKTSWQTPG